MCALLLLAPSHVADGVPQHAVEPGQVHGGLMCGSLQEAAVPALFGQVRQDDASALLLQGIVGADRHSHEELSDAVDEVGALQSRVARCFSKQLAQGGVVNACTGELLCEVFVLDGGDCGAGGSLRGLQPQVENPTEPLVVHGPDFAEQCGGGPQSAVMSRDLCVCVVFVGLDGDDPEAVLQVCWGGVVGFVRDEVGLWGNRAWGAPIFLGARDDVGPEV